MLTTNASGIYEILCAASGSRYIGQSANISRRCRSHTNALRRGDAECEHLQRAWNKYGEAAFEFRVLGLCAPEHLTFFEQQWIDARKPEYNKRLAADSNLGLKYGPQSLEHRKKIGALKLGKPLTPEHCAKLAAAKTQ